MDEVIWYLSFSDWIISLSVMLSRPIHAATNVRFPSPHGQVVFHCVNVPQLYYLLSTDGYLSNFQILAIVNNAAMNMVLL